MSKILCSLFILIIMCAVNASAQVVFADLVVTNANVHTMNTARPIASSIGVVGNRIAAIGSETDTKPLFGPNTRVIDAKGKLLIPAFNDSHVHFLETGSQLSSVDLRDAKTPQEFVERIKTFAAKLPKGRWILGGKWDHEN